MTTELLYGLDDKPPFRETIFVALQHVFAVFVGIITPPLIICNALKLDRSDTVFLVSMSLFVSGLATLIQSRTIGPVGSGLLSIQGTSFVFLGPIITAAGLRISAGAAATDALGMIFGLCLAGSFVAIAISQFIRLASRVITPLVTGTVVTLIGLTLIEVGITSMGGGFDARRDGSFGSPHNLLLSGIVVVVIVILNSSSIPQLRMTSVVIGLGVGYLAAFAMGKVDLRGLGQLPIVTAPVPLHYGLGFNPGAFIPFAFLYVITVIESIGDLTATSSLTNQPITGDVYFRRLRSGILADGINSLLAALFNSFPSTTFAQNNGVIQLTGVGSRHVGTFIAAILMLLGLFPVVGGLVQALPQAVLGGATIIMFGTVAVAGIRILSGINMNRRSSIIVAVSLGLGLGVTFVPDILRSLPELLRNTLSSGIATGGMCALLLNAVLPGERS
ncbi:MAG TPA: nucleobase:cation symporter-2 family protein [Bryobacteraceae bacterium]|nr:nucleobase:cation symporter-2 family protein [Bryobacteraceae bacterium]